MDNRHRQSFFRILKVSDRFKTFSASSSFQVRFVFKLFFEIFPELKLLYCEFSSIPFCRFSEFFAFSTKIVFEHLLKNSKNSRERSNFSLKMWKSGTNASLDKNKPQNSLSERMSWPYRLTLSPCSRISYQFYFLRWLSYLLPGLASSLGVFPIC